MVKTITTTGLRRFNLIMAGLHAVQGVAVLLLSRSFDLTITGGYLVFNPLTKHLEPAIAPLFNISLPLLLAAFFFMSAIAHIVIATLYYRWYKKGLTLGINKARWIEYAISASTMMVAVALLVGVYDASSLGMIFALTAIMNLMGLVMEVHNQTTKKTSWLSYLIGCFAGAIPWLVIAFYMWLGAAHGSNRAYFCVLDFCIHLFVL